MERLLATPTISPRLPRMRCEGIAMMFSLRLEASYGTAYGAVQANGAAPARCIMSGAEYMPDAVVFDRDSTAQGNVLYSNISAST